MTALDILSNIEQDVVEQISEDRGVDRKDKFMFGLAHIEYDLLIRHVADIAFIYNGKASTFFNKEKFINNTNFRINSCGVVIEIIKIEQL